ncbi:hypothetical protein AWC38_SpisGene22442 [Stylophora pistillata]|uniref:Uncharacterized protein n=1 Tax=Stylophora pistillata TaxID=50429 RepID=A0A2B4R9I5_STYPI|nr:hypothetical protein AWC38_SpisGene22442 [Stylophora pistillata]
MNSAKNELRAFADEQKMSFLKRIRRGAENCTTGSAESNSNATVVGGLGIVFHEIEDTGRYQGTVTWKPLQNVNGNWTGYKILTLYRPLDSPSNCCNIFECDVVDKNTRRSAENRKNAHFSSPLERPMETSWRNTVTPSS